MPSILIAPKDNNIFLEWRIIENFIFCLTHLYITKLNFNSILKDNLLLYADIIISYCCEECQIYKTINKDKYLEEVDENKECSKCHIVAIININGSIHQLISNAIKDISKNFKIFLVN